MYHRFAFYIRGAARRLAALTAAGTPIRVSGGAINGKVTVTAHSGCMGLPDNSVEAMEAGVGAGAQIVEFDLRCTVDGVPVLSHDPPKDGQNCVPLAEAFRFLRGHEEILANVDVKSTAYLETLLPAANAAGVADRIFLTGLKEQDIPAAKEKCPGVPYYLNTTVHRWTDHDALAQKALSLGAVGINIHWKNASPKLMRTCHAHGVQVSVWTVDETRTIFAMALIGADNITTRRPDLACTLIG